jgi:hypothetical protein
VLGVVVVGFIMSGWGAGTVPHRVELSTCGPLLGSFKEELRTAGALSNGFKEDGNVFLDDGHGGGTGEEVFGFLLRSLGFVESEFTAFYDLSNITVKVFIQV